MKIVNNAENYVMKNYKKLQIQDKKYQQLYYTLCMVHRAAKTRAKYFRKVDKIREKLYSVLILLKLH